MILLSKADPAKLQDAWHYAMMIVNRNESTFNGDREYPEGIRGQFKAYEHLIAKIDQMTGDNETWQLVPPSFNLLYPANMRELETNAAFALQIITDNAKRLGIDARTAEKPEQP